MPVLHLGLTVSHIPSATSFYLAALAPLGYRYIGGSGDSVGLGVTTADFFLTQEPRGKAISPAHIAFAADNRLDVRNCYAAALSAGAYPSGAPSYRDRDCTIFNAAVEDLDGNVVEFVHKEPFDAEAAEPPMTAPEHSRVLDWQQSVASSGLQDDAETADSRVSRAKSRATTVKDLVNSASRSVRSRSAAPAPLARAQTMPVDVNSEFPSKAFLGTLLGAAAGGALAWAMMKSENENAQDEAAYLNRRSDKMASRRGSLDETRSHRNYSTTESAAPRSHRNFSTTESAYSRKHPPRSMARARRAIDQTPYYNDAEVEEAISRFVSARPGPPLRSRTIDAIEYAPMSQAGRESRYAVKRSATLPPVEGVAGYLEAPKSTTSRHTSTSRRGQVQPLNIAAEEDNVWARSTASRRTETSRSRRNPPDVGNHDGGPQYAKSSTSRNTSASRRNKMSSYDKEPEVEDQPPAPSKSILSRFSSTSRRSKMPSAQDEPEPIYEDEVSSPKSSHSRHSATSRRSARQPSVTSIEEEQDLKRRDSGISMHSSRSHHSRQSRRSATANGSQHSSASTLKPSRRGSAQYDSAAGVPLPGSRGTSLASRIDSRAGSYVTAADIPMPESEDGGGYDEIGEESDGLGDTRTVVPDDSISCVDFSKPRSSAGRSHKSSSKHSGRRSEAASDRTVRGAKNGSSRDSAATLPVRTKDDYYGGSGKKRSTVSYA